jgi:hypothetical protein
MVVRALLIPKLGEAYQQRAMGAVRSAEKYAITGRYGVHTSLASDVSGRDRWLITVLLGLGLITFAIDASNTRLVLSQMMTGSSWRPCCRC